MAVPAEMELVSFITTELGDDLVVSFAVQDPTDPTEIESLTLVRSTKYESLVPPEERGVGVSFERFLDHDEDMLEEARYSKSEKTMHLETRLRWYDLDLRKVDPEELAKMCKVFRKMSRGGRFRCVGL